MWLSRIDIVDGRIHAPLTFSSSFISNLSGKAQSVTLDRMLQNIAKKKNRSIALPFHTRTNSIPLSNLHNCQRCKTFYKEELILKVSFSCHFKATSF